MKKIALIPIDNRPICYDLVKDVLAIDNDIELFMPDLCHLGGLSTESNVDELFKFVESLYDIDYLIVSLDTIAYGGLVSSRRCSYSFDEIKNRIEKFKNIASKKVKKILAFSSIMRISNNNINEEEKEYWAQWGKRIFDWSYYLHKSEMEKSYNCVLNKIPDDILDDYINTRKRNFEINKIYLNWAEQGFFDTLIFSKDDCAQYGLNVKEAQQLEAIIKSKSINNALVKTGADEIPLSLISRAVNYDNKIKINPVFIEKNSTDLISKYEDISIKNCVEAQLNIANCLIDNNDFNLNLLVNNFVQQQGDWVLGDRINAVSKKINFNDNFFVADVNNSNGADSFLIEQLFNCKTDNFFGFCGYNTSANTIGCAVFCASIKFQALKKGTYNDLAFKKFQAIRLLDDWSYQTRHRKFIRESAPEFLDALKTKENELNEDSKKIFDFLKLKPYKISYSLPWDRSFEIRIKLTD